LPASEGRSQRPASADGTASHPLSDQLTQAVGTGISQQIADGIAGCLEDLGRELPPGRPDALEQAASPALHPAVRGQPVLRVLHIALQPADLGTVVVRMVLRDDTMNVHLEAAGSETAQCLSDAREELMRALAASGYSLGDVVVDKAAADPGPKGMPMPSGQSGQPQLFSANSGQAQSGTSADGRSQGGQHGGAHGAPPADRVADDQSEHAGVSVGLFV
jgi:chemotaxis protein MotD